MMLSSATRFVEASSKAMAAVKSAPLRKIDRARATAAYEHDDEAAPRPVAIMRLFGESSGNSFVISLFETTAWTTPESPNPKINGHKISQNIANAIQRAWPRATITFVIISIFSLGEIESISQINFDWQFSLSGSKYWQ